MKKKILILISSLLSALVLFFTISFNTNVYAYDTSSETNYSKSVTSVQIPTFTYTQDSVTKTALGDDLGNWSYGFYEFTINNPLVLEDYILLINYNYGAIEIYNMIFRGSGATSSAYQVPTYNNTTANNLSNGLYNSCYVGTIKKSYIQDFINNNNNNFRIRLQFNTSYSHYEIYNIDFVPISQLSSSLYFVNYASGIQSMYDELLSDYNDLQGDYDDLENDYSTLETSYSELESQYNTLQSNYNTLQANYNDLVSNYGEMFQQYQDLQSEFESLSQAVENVKRYSYLYYLFNDVPVYTLANIDWHDVQYNYYRSDVTSAKQLVDTLNNDYTYTQDSGFWYYDKVNLNDDSQKIVFYNNIPNNLLLLKNDSNFVDLLSSDVAYYFDISKLGYKGFIEMLFDIHNWSGQVLYNYTIQVLYDNNNVVTYDLSSYLSQNEISLQSDDDYFSLGFELSPSAVGLYIKANDNGDFYPNSLYVATDTWYYNSGFSAGVQSQAVTISQLSERITDLNDVIVTLRKTIQNKDDQISNNFGWQQFFGGMADIPFLTIFNFMNVDILGFNLFHMFAGIITAIAMLWLIKRLYK